MDCDDPKALFSLSTIVNVGVDLGMPIGQTFSPTILSKAIEKVTLSHASILPFTVVLVKNGVIDRAQFTLSKPTLVLIALRLGTDCLNDDYFPLIKGALMTPLTLGIIGGKGHRAYYILGYQDHNLLFLDPHVVRPVNLDLDKAILTGEYHTENLCEMSLTHLDPTVLLGFLVRSGDDLNSLIDLLLSIPLPMPIFSLSSSS